MTEITQVGHKLHDLSYEKFRDLIANETGLYFPEKKRADLERGVLEGLARSKFESVEEYFAALSENPANGEMAGLVTLLTIGETYFYRDEGQFHLLQREVLPKLITERVATTRRLRVWSAGCSTGEEPYSLAIILRELVPYIDTWDVQILATDINRKSLEQAREGCYGDWSFRTMPDEWLDKYFFLSSSNTYYISETIKSAVRFEHLNLKDNVYPSFLNRTVDIDLIVCRNVAIYFNQDTTNQIMDRFSCSLIDGGWLLMGASDPIPPANKFWARNHSGVFIYQKKTAGIDPRQRERKNRERRTTGTAGGRLGSRPIKLPAPDPIAESPTLLEMGQPVLAAGKLEAKLKDEPQAVEALYLLAKAELAQANLSKSRALAEQAIALDKLNVKTYYLLSTIYQAMDEDHKAIEALKKAVYLDKEFIPGHFSLACLYQRQGNPGLAGKGFKNVIKLMIGRRKDEIVPESNGITYGKLLEIAVSNIK